jgi:hypothetical protein
MNRNWSSSRRILAIALATMILSTTAFAAIGSFSAPSWRGNSNATFQQWSFNGTEPNRGPVAPDDGGLGNSFGTPALYVFGNSAQRSDGAWNLVTDEMDIRIPNSQELQPLKEMQIELIWKAAQDSFLPPQPSVSVTPVYADQNLHIYPQVLLLGEEQADGWTKTVFSVNITPNPIREWIYIKGGIIVDQVSIDTRCIPEPVTFGLLIGGALMAIRRRRKV